MGGSPSRHPQPALSSLPACPIGPVAEMEHYQRNFQIKGMCSHLIEKYNLEENALAAETVHIIVKCSDITSNHQIARVQNLVHHLFSNDCMKWFQLVTSFPERHSDKITGLLARVCRKHGPAKLVWFWPRLITIVQEQFNAST